MYADISRTGAAATRRGAKKNPMQVLVDLIEGDPTDSSERLFKKWWPLIREDDDYLIAVARHAFANMLSSLERDRRNRRPGRRTKAVMAQERMAVAKLVDRTKSVVLMNLELPNGKRVRDATFAECSAAGGWFKLLATKGKPSQIVGKVLTEADLQRLK